MHPHEELLRHFYAAFDRRDGGAMAACYAPGAHFADPVFPDLNGDEPGAMWRMLTSRSTDLQVELRECTADADGGRARWVATYTFARTGRKVVNDVHSTFRFREGLIADQRDQFSFWAWSRQALGPVGLLLGWSPIVQGKVRKQGRAGLDAAR